MANKDHIAKFEEAILKINPQIWNDYNESLNKKNKEADLSGLNIEKANISNYNFKKANLTGSNLKEATLVGTDFSNAILSKTRLQGANFNEAILKGCNLQNVCLDEKTNFNDTVWGKRKDIMALKIDARNAAQIKKFYISTGNYQLADDFYRKQNKQIRKENKCCIVKLGYILWWLTCCYGIALWRWIVTTIVIILLFTSINYCCLGSQFKVGDNINGFNNYFEALYFSIVTITTLGYGDIIPLCNWARFSVICELIIGVILLGGLISIFTNKLIRR